MNTADIPVISFAPFLSGSRDDQKAVAKQIYNAFTDIGFVYLKDHGIPQSEVDAAFREVSECYNTM